MIKHKYKVKDKVRMTANSRYTLSTIELLEDCNYMLTIKEVVEHLSGPAYIMEEDSFDWIWPENLVVEILYEDPKELINDRFEILDL